MPVRLDLNNETFQRHWFSLQKQDQLAVLQCCRKLAALEWDALYRDKGLPWELIISRTGLEKERLFTIRIDRKIRAVVKRSENFVEFLALHADHDSAYH